MARQKPIVLGISGSLRRQSSNGALLASLEGHLPEGVEFRIAEGLASLPPFNPDDDADGIPAPDSVRQWREQLRAADALAICTPEYARGVPGSLKNALDWAVSSGELTNKPTAAIAASPHPDGGREALHSLLLTLRMMGATIPGEASLSVPFVGRKLAPGGGVSDAELKIKLDRLVLALMKAIPG